VTDRTTSGPSFFRVVTFVFCLLGWAIAIAIAVLSIVPPAARPTTPVAHDFEHFAIFFLLGITMGVAYAHRAIMLFFGLALYSMIVEFAQAWVPGRHPRMIDLVVDGSAAWLGAILALLMVLLVNGRRTSP
jgi:VanZ family protein